MSKREAKEVVREAIRQHRIERDAGNDTAHNHILRLTMLIAKIDACPKAELADLLEDYGINNN